MAFFTGWAAWFNGLVRDQVARATAVVLRKSDDTSDSWKSNGAGAALVSIVDATLPTGAATAALQSAAPITHVGSAALEASRVIKATPGNLRSVKVLNTSAATLYLHLFDVASLPADGAVPSRIPIPVAAGDVNGDSWEGTTHFANGCVAALSTTIETLTVAGAVGWFDAEVL